MHPRRAAGAGAILALALTACSPSAPSSPPVSPGGESPAPSGPSAPASPVEPDVAACTRADVRASTAGWTGGAGSRGADVLVEVISATACRLPAGAAVALVDAAGNVAASSLDPPPGDGPAVDPGDARTLFVEVANWCDPDPLLPFQPVVALVDDVAAVDGGAIETLDDLPPCNAPGAPPEVTVSGW